MSYLAYGEFDGGLNVDMISCGVWCVCGGVAGGVVVVVVVAAGGVYTIGLVVIAAADALGVDTIGLWIICATCTNLAPPGA